MTSRNGSSQARLVGIFVLVLIISLAEFSALLLDYQNNRYLRQYVSDNLGTIILAAIGLLFVAGGAGYVVSKRLGIPRSSGPRVPTFARIGSFVGRRYKLIIVFWILLFAASFPLSQQLSQVTTSSTSGGQSSSSQSALAQNLMAQEFSHPQSNASAIILLQGNNVTDNATKIFTLHLEQRLEAPRVLNSLENVTTIYTIARIALIGAYLQKGYNFTAAQSSANQTLWGDTLSEILSQYPKLILLAIVTPFIPLATVGMALLMAEGGLYLIGKYIIPIQDTTTTFLFTIMLGVGTDYAIFLMARYREERVEGRDKAQAIQTSITWSGESIATSATTVIIAFGAMTLTSFTLLRSIGVGLGFGVLIALLVSLTLTPSLILIAGDKIFWPTSGKRFEAYAARSRKRRVERPGYFRRAASFSVRRPVLVLGLALIISIPAIYIALTGSTSYDFAAGLPQAESVKGITVLEQSFGAGQIGPTQVLVQFPVPILVNGNLTTGAQASLEKLSQNIASLSNVKEVTEPTRPNGIPVNATNMVGLTPEERQAILGSIGKDNRTAMLTALFADEPFTQNSLNTVTQIRNLITSLQNSDSSLAQDTILVGGASASTLDFADETVDQFNTIRILTDAAISVVLLVVLGLYPLAITWIVSIVLSIICASGATLLFFNNVLQSGVLFIIPLVLFLLLYGIGMDYNIFILTRIREEAQKGKEAHQAVVDAVDRTGGIITALALILAGALGSLLLSSNRLLEGFGFAIALAVVLDAMVVRTYLVPAGMSLLGRRAWWGPNRLRRVRFEKNNEASAKASEETIDPAATSSRS